MENNVIIHDKSFLFEPSNITKETIKKYLCKEATDEELTLGLQIAKTFNLNPLKREVYFVKYRADQPMQVLTGYEVYLKRAERSGKYGGLETTTEGSIAEGNLKAIVKIYRKDWDKPLVHEADYSEYVQMKKDFKTGVVEPNTFWKNKPKTMIKKVAESQGFRKAFPDEFDGMPYTSDEVVDQERIIDIKEVEKTEKIEKITEPAQMPSPFDANDVPLNKEQGEDLLKFIKAQGYASQDLKEMIHYDLNLKGLTEIKIKHLLQIRKAFAKKKEVASA